MSILESIDKVKQFAPVFQAVIDVAAELEKIGSIQQATSEANALLLKARNERADAMQQLANVNAQMAEAKDNLAKAKAQAGLVVSAAQEEARGLLRVANDDVAVARATLKQQLVALERDIKKAHETHQQVTDQVAAKLRDLAALEKKIADTKAAAVAALG